MQSDLAQQCPLVSQTSWSKNPFDRKMCSKVILRCSPGHWARHCPSSPRQLPVTFRESLSHHLPKTDVTAAAPLSRRYSLWAFHQLISMVLYNPEACWLQPPASPPDLPRMASGGLLTQLTALWLTELPIAASHSPEITFFLRYPGRAHRLWQ